MFCQCFDVFPAYSGMLNVVCLHWGVIMDDIEHVDRWGMGIVSVWFAE